MQTQTRFKYFSSLSFDKEAEYLRTQHQKGLAFRSKSPIGLFRFDEVAEEDYEYRLDYFVLSYGIDDYRQMMADQDWEYIGTFGQFNYFRRLMDMHKEVVGLEEEPITKDRLVDQVTKVRNYRLIVFGVVLLMSVIRLVQRGVSFTQAWLWLIFGVIAGLVWMTLADHKRVRAYIESGRR